MCTGCEADAWPTAKDPQEEEEEGLQQQEGRQVQPRSEAE